MHKKIMDKAIAKIIRETRHKEREENRVQNLQLVSLQMNMQSQYAATRSARTNFEYNWSTTIVKETGQHLHEHLRASWATQGP
jgi:hypothetical protein